MVGTQFPANTAMANAKLTFEDIVDIDIKEENSPYAEFLRKPENIQQWYDVLRSFFFDLERQFVARKLELDAKRIECKRRGEQGRAEFTEFQLRYLKWRRSALVFRSLLQFRIREAKQLIATGQHNQASYIRVCRWLEEAAAGTDLDDLKTRAANYFNIRS